MPEEFWTLSSVSSFLLSACALPALYCVWFLGIEAVLLGPIALSALRKAMKVFAERFVEFD